MKSAFLRLSLAAAVAGMAGGAFAQSAAPAQPGFKSCFYWRDMQSWRPSADDKTIYLRVNGASVYKLDLVHETPQLKSAGAHLINHTSGPDTVCSPTDLDLKVAGASDIAVPLFVKSLEKLGPEQVAALSKAETP